MSDSKNVFLRKAVPADITCVMQIMTDARLQMLREGKKQWQGSYPALEHIEKDIRSKIGYVLCDGYTILAYAAIASDADASYARIDGAWLNDLIYLVVHRLAVAEEFKHQGVAALFFDQVERLALMHGVSDIRVDTNYDNEYMLRLLNRLEYRYCGEICNPNGQRKAFQKHLAQPSESSFWFLFQGDDLLLFQENGGELQVPQGFLSPFVLSLQHTVHAVPDLNGTACFACRVDKDYELPESCRPTALRASYDCLPLDIYKKAGYAFQQLFWDDNTRFCPACGTMNIHQNRIMKKCPACGKESYPPISTAIMVLIRRGNEIVMVRSRTFKGNYYGLIAGFLEPGETLEECVEREVFEETHLYIKNLRYFRSQTWPYPSGLMVGFVADYAGGEMVLQEEELCAGGFFSKDNLPEIPKKLSLARQLIDWWLEQSE